MAKRWSRRPRETGIAGVAAACRPRELLLKDRGKLLAIVGVYSSTGRFYHYGDGRNSLWDGVTYATEDEAKAAALAAVNAADGQEATT